MDEKLKKSMIDLLCEVIRFEGLMKRSVDSLAYDRSSMHFQGVEKRVDGATNRLNRKLGDIMEQLNVEFLTLSGEFQPELPVTPLNMDDFEAGDKLYIKEIVEPVVKEKGTSRVLRMGKVLLAKR